MISRSCIRNLFSLRMDPHSQHLSRHRVIHCSTIIWHEYENVTKGHGQHLSRMATFS